MFTGIRLKLIDNAALVRKKWSFILNSIGTVIFGILLTVPDAVITIWNSLPDEVKQMVPPKYVYFVPLVIYVLGLVSQYVKQQKLVDEQKKKENGTL